MDTKVNKLKNAIDEAEYVVVGAGAGLSTAAGFIYDGERFEKHFYDFKERFAIRDIYSGGFYPFPDELTRWAWWSRHIYYNRYVDAPRPVYDDLFDLIDGRKGVNAGNDQPKKDYFVITTNVDHCFQKAGFEKTRLFYTQGDYGLWQCSLPCHDKTYDNEDVVIDMLDSQGFVPAEDGVYAPPADGKLRMQVDKSLLPVCPVCGRPMTMNLRADNTFVEDAGWHDAAARYNDFLEYINGKVLFLELGVGANTPVIIKYPFWRMTASDPDAMYACLNFGEAFAPEEIRDKAICINGDIGDILEQMK